MFFFPYLTILVSSNYSSDFHIAKLGWNHELNSRWITEKITPITDYIKKRQCQVWSDIASLSEFCLLLKFSLFLILHGFEPLIWWIVPFMYLLQAFMQNGKHIFPHKCFETFVHNKCGIGDTFQHILGNTKRCDFCCYSNCIHPLKQKLQSFICKLFFRFSHFWYTTRK